jgi:hypothetical protein
MMKRATLLATLLAAAFFARAQEVPADYQDLYSFLDQKLDSFDQSIGWDGGRYPVAYATELLSANGNRGRALLGANALTGVRLELDRLRALNVKAVTVAVPYPILDPAFLQWNGDPGDRQPLIGFFAQVAAETHARGMKLLVENGVMFGGVYSAGSGMNAAGWYATLTDAQLVAGRAAQVLTIVSQVGPDLLNVGSEPDTEAYLTGHAFLKTPSGFASMVQTFTSQLAGADLTGVPIVAGAPSWLQNASSFIALLAANPGLWGIDIHLYPVNLDFPDRAIALAAQARAAGKKVTMLECWLQKERDSELATMQPAVDATLFARDALDFWGPLDRKFLGVMVKYANASKIEFLSPFWSRYDFAYLDTTTALSMTTDQIIAAATAAHAQALASGQTTATGRFWAALAGSATGALTVTKLVPVVLDVAGLGGARFTTELTLANRGTTAASVRLDYVPAASLGASGAGSAVLPLGPGVQMVLPDALGLLRDQGVAIPQGSNQGGTFRVTFTGLSSADVAYAGTRTTTPSGTGRAGVGIPAVDGTEASVSTSFIYGLRANANDRSNLALANADTAGPVTLRVTLYSGADGRSVVLSPDTTLGPGQWTQIGNVLAPSGFANGYARIDTVAGNGPYLAYGVFNDNATNDGSFVPSEPAALPAEARLVPVLVESATFQSELVLTNPTAAPATATLTYVESASPQVGAGGTVSLVFGPGEQKILPGAVDFLRQQGAALGPKGSAAFAGSLLVAFNGGAARGFAGARTSAPAPGGGGYGLFYAGSGASSAAGAETWVFGLQQNGTNRSNLALTSPPGGGGITLRVDVFDGDAGRLAGSAPLLALSPGGWVQLNAVLAPFGVANGYARIARVSGTGPFLAYGVVNDGPSPSSGATNDGSFIAMAGH